MLGAVWNFWIGVISTCFGFLFTLKINENPDISIGMLLLGFATIGLAIYFILGSGIIGDSFNSTNNFINRNEKRDKK